jgi:hypothetical protein
LVSEQSAVTTLIARGRLRQIRHLLIQQASLSIALVLGGAILLLILGTQILNWYWLAILFAVSLAVSAYRGRNKILSRYRVAQSIDAHLGFHDALSTAYFFGQHPEGLHSSPDLVAHQKDVAEQLARSADLRQGVPFLAPRTFYLNAALALAVVSMFGVRYGITRSLDLRASLIHIDFDGFFGSSRQVADAKKRAQLPFEKTRQSDAAAEQWESKTTDLEPQPDTPLDTIDEPETTSPDKADSSSKSDAKGKDESPKGDDLLNSPDKNQNAGSNSDKPGEAKDSPDGQSQPGNQDDAQQNSDKSSNSSDKSSLADKMRDALANLMAKLKTQPKNTEGKQQGGSSAQPGQQTAQKQQSQNQQQKGNPGEQQSENNGNSQSQSDQQSQGGAQQSAQNQGPARNSDQTTKDGKSGIGRQDGDKSAREAEQLAAMGKISEIIGKRAANVSGEVMVEVASGKQQLKTQYSDRSAQHTEAGGEINRDEIPLAYQQYVQQYFEEIRKEPAATKAAKPDAKPKASN